MAGLLCQALSAYIFVIFIGVVLSWFPAQPGGALSQIRELVQKLTDPVFVPVRRAVPLNFGGLDFSPILVIFGLQIVRNIIC